MYHHLNCDEKSKECISNNDEGDDGSNAPFCLAGLMDENNQVEKMVEEDHPSFDICDGKPFDEDELDMPPSPVDPSPLPSNHPLPPCPNSKPRANKSSKVSSNRKKKKKLVSSTKNNKGVRVDNIYQTRLNEANERVAAIVGNTYTVRSSTDEMDWMDVADFAVLQTTVKP